MLGFLSTKNYKNLSSGQTYLRNLNIFIGSNASGKSNFISCLQFLKNCLTATDETRGVSSFEDIQYNPSACETILILDDLDCRNAQTQRDKLLQSVSSIDKCQEIETFVGFAAPEIEAWIVADWDRSVAQHPDFRSRHERMRYWLSTERNMPFSDPESFSEYDSQRDCCIEKLSEALIESAQFLEDRERNLPIYSKRLHTPALLLMIEAATVQQRCPEFRQLYNHFHRNF